MNIGIRPCSGSTVSRRRLQSSSAAGTASSVDMCLPSLVGGTVAPDEPAVERHHHLLPRRDRTARREPRLEPALHAGEREQVLLDELPDRRLLLAVELDEV